MNNIQHNRGVSGVYIIVNLITKESYIGSSRSIYYRIGRHKCDLIKDRSGNRNLQVAWNTHGEKSFLVKVLELCPEEKLLEREQHYMDTLKPEYNITKDVFSNKPSEESKLLISKTLKKRYEEGMDCYRQRHLWRTVEQYDLFGNFIQSFPSATHAAKFVDVHRNDMYKACDSKSIARFGFQWKYKGDDKEIFPFAVSFTDPTGPSKVIKVLSPGKSILYFPSIPVAADFLKIGKTTIARRLNSIVDKCYKGYSFEQVLPRDKPDELLETPVEDNQQPS
jgi:hypothetical protein